jgi:PRTRC genetic system protein A
VVRIVRPDQEAGAASIRYDAGGDQDGVICDLHSHHTMHAFFSATDDCDEGGFRFYAVVGQVLARPEIRLRLGMYGDFVSLPMTALFTSAGPFVDLCGQDDTEVSHGG